MAESEVYRVEIPIIVEDQSEVPLERARERVNRFQQAAEKSNRMIQKQMQSLAKLQIEPVMRIRDQLTASVLKADRLVKRLGMEQASPIIAAQDRVSAVVTRINAVLDALDKGKVEVLADMKGPLMDEIVKARAALSALNGVKAGPVAELRGELFGQLAKAMSQLRGLDKFEARPEATLKEKVLWKAREIGSTLRNLTSRVWTVTLRAKDKVTDVAKRVIGLVTSPLALLGAGAGATAAIAYPLKLAGEFEQARMSMDFFMGSAEKGKKAFEDLIAFAAKTPFEFPFLQEMSIMLMGAGYSFDQAKRALTAFGDAAGRTGAGMEGIQNAMLGFTQIASSGTLNLQDLRQVALNLRVPLNMFAKELGVAESELGDIGKKGIPAQKAMEAIVRTLEKRFGGGMKQLSESFFGLVSTIKDTARLTVWSFGAGMADPVKRILLDIVGTTDYSSEKFKAFQKKLEDAGRKIGEKFEQMYQRVKQFWGELSADPEFQKKDFGDKIIYIINLALDKISTWLNSEGGMKLQTIFAKIGEIAAKAWLAGLKGAVKGMTSSAASGNILGAGAMLGLASALGGGLVLKGAGLVGKGLITAGKWGFGKIMPATAGAAGEVAQAATAAGASGKLGILSRIKIPAGIVSKFPAIGKAGKFLGKIALPLAIVAETIDIIRAQDKVKALLQGIGGIGAGMGGSKLGAMIGTAIAPGIGTAIGGIMGGLGGYFLGRFAGGKTVDIARGRAKYATNVPVAVKPMTQQVIIEVHAESKPIYNIETAVDANDVLRIIRSNEKAIADQLADDISRKLAASFNNMPLGIVGAR